MKKINKSGFTMVELLATIVIIGILGTIGVVGVTKSMKSAKDRYYVAQNKLFISAAQTYFTDNKSRLPMKSGTFKQVTLKTLNDENYIEKMVDYSKKEYNKDSYVTVTKLGLNMYSYEGVLIDSKENANNFKESGNDDAIVTFRADNSDFSSSTTKYTNKEKVVYITIKDNDGIAGYIISIQRGSKIVNEMDYIEAGGVANTTNQVTISTDKYGDGEYRVKVKVYDKYNDQISYTSGKIVVDTIKPKCVNSITPSKPDGDNGWYRTTIKTKPDCNDSGSGCDEDKFKITTTGASGDKTAKKQSFNVEKDGMSTLKYVIYDKAGNETECQTITLKKDSEPPSCFSGTRTIQPSNSTYNQKWTKENVVLTSKCKDTISKCERENYTLTFTNSINENKSVTIKDNAGNTNTCTTTQVMIDKTPPTCKVSGGNSNWTNGAVEIKAEWDDKESGPQNKQTFSYPYTSSINISNAGAKGENNGGTVCDNVGNCTNCPANQQVKIDKVEPKTTISNSNNNKWVNFSYSFTVNTEVGKSGVKYLQRKIDGGAWENINTNKTQYETNDWSQERNSKVCYRAVSNSEMVGVEGCTQVKIDKTPPTVNFTHSTNSTRVYATCSDKGGSGLNSSYNPPWDLEDTPHDEANTCGNATGIINGKRCHSYTDAKTAPNKCTHFQCKDNAGNEKKDCLEVTCSYNKKGKLVCN